MGAGGCKQVLVLQEPAAHRFPSPGVSLLPLGALWEQCQWRVRTLRADLRLCLAEPAVQLLRCGWSHRAEDQLGRTLGIPAQRRGSPMVQLRSGRFADLLRVVLTSQPRQQFVGSPGSREPSRVPESRFHSACVSDTCSVLDTVLSLLVQLLVNNETDGMSE